MFKKYLLVFTLFIFSSIVARANFVYDATCIDAYKAILSLRMSEARQLIAKVLEANRTSGFRVQSAAFVPAQTTREHAYGCLNCPATTRTWFSRFRAGCVGSLHHRAIV